MSRPGYTRWMFGIKERMTRTKLGKWSPLTNHGSQRSNNRERQSQEKRDSMQLEGAYQTHIGGYLGGRKPLTWYVNWSNHSMNGNTVPSIAEATHSSKNRVPWDS